nr:hypothetical protein Iba_chr01bCG14460 [Ipomoea batatas]
MSILRNRKEESKMEEIRREIRVNGWLNRFVAGTERRGERKRFFAARNGTVRSRVQKMETLVQVLLSTVVDLVVKIATLRYTFVRV